MKSLPLDNVDGEKWTGIRARTPKLPASKPQAASRETVSGRGKPQKRSEAVNEQGNQCEATHSKPWAAGEETIRTAKLPTVNHGKRVKK